MTLELDIIKLLQVEELIDYSIHELLQNPKYVNDLLIIQPTSILTFREEEYIQLIKEQHLVAYSDLLKRYIQNEFNHELSFESFRQKYGEKWLKLSSIYCGQLINYFENKWKEKPIITIQPYKKSKKFQQVRQEQTNQKLTRQLARKTEELNSLQQKYEVIQLQLTQLHQEKEQLQQLQIELQHIQEENLFLKKKERLIGADIVVVGIDWHEETITRLIHMYHLKTLICYSAVEKLQQIDRINNKIVIFSASQARHQTFYKLKQNKSISLFITNELNAERVLKQLIETFNF